MITKPNRWLWLLFIMVLSQSCAYNTRNDNVDNLKTITASLKRLQTEGGEGGYVIFVANEKKNYYVQFSGSRSTRLLDAEAVSNKFLKPEYSLRQEQIAKLISMGWKPPSVGSKGSPNYFRDWKSTNDEERLTIGQAVLRTLIDVYGLDNSRPITLQMDLKR